jgi:hypothetical protein
VVSQVPPCNRIALVVLRYCHFQSSTLPCCQFISEPCHYSLTNDSMYPSCFYLAKVMSFPIIQWWSPLIRSSPIDKIHHPSTLEFGKDDHDCLHVYSAKGVVVLKLILWIELNIWDPQCFSHIFQLSKSPILPWKHLSYPFLPSLERLSFRKSQDDISFKGGGLYPPCYGLLNCLH